MLFVLILLFFGVAPASGQAYATHDDPTLATLVNDALERNPDLSAAFARYRAAAQRIPQAVGLPDPQVGLTDYVRTPETRVGPQTAMLSISQRFPWLGKLRTQGQAAEKEAAAMAAEFEGRKDQIVLEVKRAYHDLAFVDRALAIAHEELHALRHFETLAQARYSQGVGLQQAAVRLQAEITRTLSRLHTLERRRVDLEATLNALRNRDPATPIPPATLAEPAAEPLDLPNLYALAQERRPELVASLLRIEKSEKQIEVARKQGYPDFTVGAGFTRVGERHDPSGRAMPPPDDGKNIYSVTVGVNLPIYRRKYRAGVLEATEIFTAARDSYRGLWNQIQSAIRSTAFRIDTLREQIELFRNTLLPQAEQALQSAEASYATGGVGVLDLLDSERVLLDVRLGLAQFRSDHLKALAELERAIGAPFPEMNR